MYIVVSVIKYKSIPGNLMSEDGQCAVVYRLKNPFERTAIVVIFNRHGEKQSGFDWSGLRLYCIPQ